VAAQMDQLYASNDPVATDPIYAGATYYFTHAYRNLGSIQWQFHLSVPTSAVYYNTNTAQFTLVAYNPLNTSQLATIYSNNVAIGSLTLAPSALTTQTLASINPVTLVTNVVPALVEHGVAIGWPTLLNSNYTVQAATDLTRSPAWTNLAAPISGDGTTNHLFDPSGSNGHKFYRVQQTP